MIECRWFIPDTMLRKIACFWLSGDDSNAGVVILVFHSSEDWNDEFKPVRSSSTSGSSKMENFSVSSEFLSSALSFGEPNGDLFSIYYQNKFQMRQK